MATSEPPDSACEIKQVHAVSHHGANGVVTFALEVKRPLQGSGYDQPEQSQWSMFYQRPPVFEHYVIRVEETNGDHAEIRMTEVQLRALLRSVRVTFLKHA